MSIAAKAMAARQPYVREKRMPKYNVMAKIGPGWMKIGAAWEFKSGSEGLSVQLTTIPLNWDGKCAMFLPNVREPGEEG